MRWFFDGASNWTEKLFTDIDLPPLIHDEDKNFGGLIHLGLDFRTSWRHVQAKNLFIFVCLVFVTNNNPCVTHVLS